MIRRNHVAWAALLVAASTAAPAATVSYSFDSVSQFDLKNSQSVVTGILRNASTPTTVTFAESVNGDFRYQVSRCVPVFLTMMEKPGRYYLNITIDDAASNLGLLSCGLELRI